MVFKMMKALTPANTAMQTAMDINNNRVATILARLMVTTWRYLILNSKARCLSTLIAVIVANENVLENMLTKFQIFSLITHRFQLWLRAVRREATVAGCTRRPTPRSENTMQRRNNLDGGLRDDSFWSAIRMSAFPSVAVMDDAMFKATKIGVKVANGCGNLQ